MRQRHLQYGNVTLSGRANINGDININGMFRKRTINQQQPSGGRVKRSRWTEERLSVFMDNTNIQAGTQHPLDYSRLALLVKDGRSFDVMVVVGSHPDPRPVNNWEQAATAAGWATRGLERVHGKEQAVDEVLHAMIFDALDRPTHHSKRLVLLTGDGNGNGDASNSSFLKCVQSALRREIPVEVWAWSASCSHKYAELAVSHSNLFTLRFLDGQGF